jgi:GT2 family glycosyltransferase
VLVSLVIVNWNGRHHLEQCLGAVAAQQGVEFETIVVDNGSTDGSAAFLRERYPWVRLLALPANTGFAGGNNAGARQARGRYLAFLNNDTAPEPTWLQALVAGVDEPNRFTVTTSCIVYMEDPTQVDSTGDGVLRWGGPFKRHHGGSVDDVRRSEEVFAACGCAFLMPRALFEELGGFDEDFFVSHEDVDLSYRARLLGHRVRYAADAVVRHHGSATLGLVSESSVRNGQRNAEWMYVKNTPLWILVRTLPGHIFYNLLATVYFARTGRLRAFIAAKAAAAAGIPRMLAKRAAIQRTARVGSGAIWPLQERRWLTVKRREKAFVLDPRRGRL